MDKDGTERRKTQRDRVARQIRTSRSLEEKGELNVNRTSMKYLQDFLGLAALGDYIDRICKAKKF